MKMLAPGPQAKMGLDWLQVGVLVYISAINISSTGDTEDEVDTVEDAESDPAVPQSTADSGEDEDDADEDDADEDDADQGDADQDAGDQKTVSRKRLLDEAETPSSKRRAIGSRRTRRSAAVTGNQKSIKSVRLRLLDRSIVAPRLDIDGLQFAHTAPTTAVQISFYLL